MKSKKWVVSCLSFLGIALSGIIMMTIVVDPLFHYHKPLPFLSYPVVDEDYQNDGIVKQFDYNAIITGTSMTQNFKSSEMDRLFDVNSIKVTFAGASFIEIGENLKQAIQANGNVSCIIWGLDYNSLFLGKDERRYLESPTYLYDNNIVNDVNYVLNMDILLSYTARVLYQTLRGVPNMNFDTAHNWDAVSKYGKEIVDLSYERKEKVKESEKFDADDKIKLKENLEQNVIGLIEENPKTDFYLFFPPYSIYFYDECNQTGRLEVQLEAEKEAIELLVPYENVHLFAFTDQFDLITDLDNYKDAGHYSGKINTWMLECMSRGEHLITKDNYLEYCDKVERYLMSYDYDSLFY